MSKLKKSDKENFEYKNWTDQDQTRACSPWWSLKFSHHIQTLGSTPMIHNQKPRIPFSWKTPTRHIKHKASKNWSMAHSPRHGSNTNHKHKQADKQYYRTQIRERKELTRKSREKGRNLKQKRETKQAKTPKVRILYYLFLFLFASSLSPPVSRVGAIETRAKRGMEVASYINTLFMWLMTLASYINTLFIWPELNPQKIARLAVACLMLLSFIYHIMSCMALGNESICLWEGATIYVFMKLKLHIFIHKKVW